MSAVGFTVDFFIHVVIADRGDGKMQSTSEDCWGSGKGLGGKPGVAVHLIRVLDRLGTKERV